MLQLNKVAFCVSLEKRHFIDFDISLLQFLDWFQWRYQLWVAVTISVQYRYSHRYQFGFLYLMVLIPVSFSLWLPVLVSVWVPVLLLRSVPVSAEKINLVFSSELIQTFHSDSLWLATRLLLLLLLLLELSLRFTCYTSTHCHWFEQRIHSHFC
jgi:hypothetical protein